MTTSADRSDYVECLNVRALSEQLRKASQAENTRIAYSKGWRCFTGYCKRYGIAPLSATPEQIADFFIRAGTEPSPSSGRMLSLGTLTLYRSAINRRYKEAGCVSPAAGVVVNDVLKGLARLRGKAPRQVRALREHHIAAMLERCADTPIGLRDAAVLAVGFAAALRRSELCGLKLNDVERVRKDRMIIHIRQSKTDQARAGQWVAVPEGKMVRPITHLQLWLNISGIRKGYLFQTIRRSGQVTGSPLHHCDVSRLVKHYVKEIGLNPKEFSAHSLRAGFVTSAAVHHARLDKIMEITRHRSPAMVLRYIRDEDAFTEHAGDAFL